MGRRAGVRFALAMRSSILAARPLYRNLDPFMIVERESQ